MNRKQFIKTGLALMAAGVAAYFMVPNFTTAVLRMLNNEIQGVDIDPTSTKKFIEDANREQFWLKFSRSKKILISWHTSLAFVSPMLPYRNKYLLYKSQIAGQFFMSTDLFLNKMDLTKKITYSGFYNPYKQPCYNPFSANHYPETA